MFDKKPKPDFYNIDFSKAELDDHLFFTKDDLGVNGVSLIKDFAKDAGVKLSSFIKIDGVDFWVVDITPKKNKNEKNVGRLILDYLNRRGDSSPRDFCKGISSTTAKDRKEALAQLIDAGLIEVNYVATGGRLKTVYKSLEDRPKKFLAT